MMREQADPAFLANLVSMLRADIDGALWLVDDEQEALFYQRFVDKRARVVAAPKLALQILQEVERRGVEGVIASVRGSALEPDLTSVFRPSTGDVASLLLISQSCGSVIEDICGLPWLTATDKQVGPIRHRVVSIARWLGHLQRIYIDEGADPSGLWNLGEVIRWDTFEVDWDRLRATLTEGCSLLGLLGDARIAASKERGVAANISDCDGNDALRVLAAATRYFRPRGLGAQRIVEAAELFGMLRVAYRLDEIETDDMFWLMKQWEWNNSRYPLLQRWRTLVGCP